MIVLDPGFYKLFQNDLDSATTIVRYRTTIPPHNKDWYTYTVSQAHALPIPRFLKTILSVRL